MVTENCPHCGNKVRGEFSPSNTRKLLTSIAKKGGMKAVMAYVGSVFPGIGNVTGFLVGAGIDFIYGDDISKFIDKIADEIDENKIYVFSCPQCGYEWSRKEEELDSDFPISSSYSGTSTESSSYMNGARTKIFKDKFEDFLERIDAATEDPDATEDLSKEMERIGNNIGNSDSAIASQYYFLAGLCDLLYAKECYPDTNARKQLKRARANFKRAITFLEDGEYKLMLEATETLLCMTPQECVKKGTIETAYYNFENDTLFKEDWLIGIYESCRYKSISHFDDILMAQDNDDDDTLLNDLWLSGCKFTNPEYHLISLVELVLLHIDERTSTGKLSTKCAKYLNEAHGTEGYSVEACEIDNYADMMWLLAYVYYAISIIEGINPYTQENQAVGLNMLMKAADFGDCYASQYACRTLGRYYETGQFVECNLDNALTYYTRAKKLSDEDIERVKTAIQLQQSSKITSISVNSDFSSAESEYLEELKALLEDGEISKSERRLLDKLRIKLGLSETRAAEIEAQLNQPPLTENEQEYLSEYKECLAEGGSISAGERRLLDKLRIKLGIDQDRATQLETL